MKRQSQLNSLLINMWLHNGLCFKRNKTCGFSALVEQVQIKFQFHQFFHQKGEPPNQANKPGRIFLLYLIYFGLPLRKLHWVTRLTLSSYVLKIIYVALCKSRTTKRQHWGGNLWRWHKKIILFNKNYMKRQPVLNICYMVMQYIIERFLI